MANLLSIPVADMITKTKKELQVLAAEQCQKVNDSGDSNVEELYAKLVRLKEYVNSFEKALKNSDSIKLGEYYGLKVTEMNTGDRLDYSKDPEYARLEAQLKERKELLDLVTKKKTTLYDSDGVLIEPVPVKTYSSTTTKTTF